MGRLLAISIVFATAATGSIFPPEETYDTGIDISVTSWYPDAPSDYEKNICGVISEGRIAYELIRFDTDGPISDSAGLYIAVCGRNGGSVFNFYVITEAWNGSATWNDCPDAVEYVTSLTVEYDRWYIVNFPDVPAYGWLIKADEMGELAQFYSFESSYKPYLIVYNTGINPTSLGRIKSVYR